MFSPDNMPQLSPYFTVSDAAKAIEFYKNAFGFIVTEGVKDEKGNYNHVSMKKEDAIIMFAPEGAWEDKSWGDPKKTPKNLGVRLPINMYIYCEDVDALYKQAIKNGAKSLAEPNDSFWGDRFCTLLDIDGYEWLFAHMLKK